MPAETPIIVLKIQWLTNLLFSNRSDSVIKLYSRQGAFPWSSFYEHDFQVLTLYFLCQLALHFACTCLESQRNQKHWIKSIFSTHTFNLKISHLGRFQKWVPRSKWVQKQSGEESVVAAGRLRVRPFISSPRISSSSTHSVPVADRAWDGWSRGPQRLWTHSHRHSPWRGVPDPFHGCRERL